MSPGAQNIRSGQGWRGGWGQPVDPQAFPVAHRMQHARKQLAGRGHLGDAAPMTLVPDADAAGALAGRWGPVVWQASLAAELDLAIVSAVIVVLGDAHEGLPMLAFAMTDPACHRRGIGRWLIEESMRRLDATGVKELHLAVTRGNRAFALYQRLGFEVVPSRQDPEVPGRNS